MQKVPIFFNELVLCQQEGWIVEIIHQTQFVQFSMHFLIIIELNLLQYDYLHLFKLISLVFKLNIVIHSYPSLLRNISLAY